MRNLVDFTDKRILIIGGSSGIGRETAVTLSRLGAKILLVARTEEKLKDTLNSLEGEGHEYRVFDVSKVDSIEEFINCICVEFGKLDGMVYSAGTAYSLPLNMLTKEKLQWIFNVNFFGFVECVRQITKKGNYNPGMRIIGISSVASMKGDSAHVGYSSSKAAMDGAVRSMAVELAKKDICINTIAPGMTNTRMYDEFIEQYGIDSIDYQLLIRRQCKRIVDTTEVANAIAFLLSSSARFITGICMPVDCGYTA